MVCSSTKDEICTTAALASAIRRDPGTPTSAFGGRPATPDRIVLSNGPSSGFESDNYIDRAAPWTIETNGPMPGNKLAVVAGLTITIVHEPASGLPAFLGAALLVRRR